MRVIREDGGLDGGVLDAIVSVDASERVEPIDATYSGACSQTVLHNKLSCLAVNVEVLGLADLVVLHDAKDLEEPIVRVLVARLVLGLREHELAEVGRREVATCGDIIVSQN